MKYYGPENLRNAALAWAANVTSTVLRRTPQRVCVELGAHGKQIFTLRTLRGLICASILTARLVK